MHQKREDFIILFTLTNRYSLSIASRPATHLIAATCLSLALTVAVVTGEMFILILRVLDG